MCPCGRVSDASFVVCTCLYSDATLKPIPHREMALASARRAGWGHHAISCVLEAKERPAPCEVSGWFKDPVLESREQLH